MFNITYWLSIPLKHAQRRRCGYNSRSRECLQYSL